MDSIYQPAQGLRPLPINTTLNKFLKIMNKKFYMAPECEEIILQTEGFLAASTDIDEGDPVPMGAVPIPKKVTVSKRDVNFKLIRVRKR